MRALHNFFTGVVVFSLCALCAPAAEADSSLIPQVSSLDNGLTLIVSHMPESPMVSVYGLVRVGAASEGEYLGSGLAHFTEHMVFKGTQKRGVGDIPKEVQSLGGTINASTGLDYTIYTLTVPKEHFRKAVDILSDMLNNARFDAEDIEYERDVVFNEMRMHDDRPERVLSKHVMETVYLRHPYRLPVIGFKDLLASVSQDDFRKFYHTHYIPNNMIVSVAGDVTEEEAVSVVEEKFGGYPRQKYPQRIVMAEPVQLSARHRDVGYATPVVRMSMVYQGVAIADPDLFALDTLAMILGQGRSSRLERILVEDKRLVQSVSVSNFTPMDMGGFEIECSFSTDADRAEIEAVIGAEIEKVKQENVTPRELTIAKKRVLKDHVMGQLTSAGMAYRTAVDYALTGDGDFSSVYARGIHAVTAEDIKRVAKKYLQPSRLSVVVLKPEEKNEENSLASTPVTSEIRREVLSNGIVVLLKEDHRTGVVFSDIVMSGGVRQEPDGKNGISGLVASLWAKAAGPYTSKTFAEFLDEHAIRLSGFSGMNSIGLRMSSLTQDFETGLDALALAFTKARFAQDDFDLAKQQRLFAIAKRDEDIADFTKRQTLKHVFPDHSLGLTALGEHDDIESITRKEVLRFYKHCKTSRIVIAVFGDMDSDQTLQRIQRLFGHLNVVGQSFVKDTSYGDITQHDSTLFLDKDQAAFATSCRGVAIDHPDRYGLEVLGAVIGSPFRGRMFSHIREEMGLSYRLGGGFQPAVDGGFLLFFVQSAPENAETVKTEMQMILNDVQQKGPGEEELSDIKAYLKGNFERSLETPESFAFQAALDELYGLGYDTYTDYEARIDAVSCDDVKRLADEYCRPDEMSSTLTLPQR